MSQQSDAVHAPGAAGAHDSRDFSSTPAARLLFTRQLRQLYARVKQSAEGTKGTIWDRLLDEMKVSLDVEPADLARVPATGPVVVVANHPFGILDGVILTAVLLRVRPDVKVLANFILSAVPELRPHCIYVDPFNGKGAKENNSRGLKQAVAHLRNQGMLVVFPAGEVSHWQFRHGEICDPEWSETTSRLIRITRAAALPVLFVGSNSVPFHLLGMVHPILRTARLPHEFFNKTGKTIAVRIGNPVAAGKISSIPDDSDATRYLRWKTYLLANRANNSTPDDVRFRIAFPKRYVAVGTAVRSETLIDEIEALPTEQNVEQNRDFAVYAASAYQIPNALSEIGRLRELSFREVGEGTGKAIDLDRYDSYYTHLILWSRRKQEIAGAYRLANTAEVLTRRGIRGLYTSSLFAYDLKIFDEMGPALELGRSFVRTEYQKQYAPLLMLWKGIARYVALHPETPILFGAVSMSSQYTQASRELLVRFFESHSPDPLAKFVRPKRSFRPRRKLREWELSAVRHLLDVDELSESISQIEKDGKGIPILLKQYLKVGGTILAFNVDRAFSNVLDGLIMVDLRKTDPSRLETYMSRAGVAGFQQFHGLPCLSNRSEPGL
jgi:putative hemolysin